MKTYVRYLIVCLFTLSPAICRAESRKVEQDLDYMYRTAKTLTVTNSNHTGTTDFVTYTCSSGAEFMIDGAKSGGKLAIFLEASGEKVETTTIQNLDSLRIYYMPNAKVDMTVSVKKGAGDWVPMPVVKKQKGLNTVKMPHADDYQVQIQWVENVYITQIDYIYVDLSDCPNCFLYKP